jgi:hypothetical protein
VAVVVVVCLQITLQKETTQVSLEQIHLTALLLQQAVDTQVLLVPPEGQEVLEEVVVDEEILPEGRVIHRHHLYHRMCQAPFKVMLVAILRN